MNDTVLLKRITANRTTFGGKPIISGMRISVELIPSPLAQGESEDAILADYADLEHEDVRACLAYAHAIIAQDSLDTVQVQRHSRLTDAPASDSQTGYATKGMT